MIIRRYIGSQVLFTTLAVAGLLTVILMSGRLIQFFDNAASGKIAVNLVTVVLWYRLPGFLELILPLGLFMGLLLVLGRLYLDNEMAVLSAAGIGPGQHIRWLTPTVALITVMTAGLAVWWTPYGYAEADRISAEQKERSAFDLIQPGRFQRVGDRMLYADLSDDRTLLRDVLILESAKDKDGRGERQIILQADEGLRVTDPRLGGAAIELRNGERWEVRPGEADFQRVRFDSYRMRMPQADAGEREVSTIKAVPTPELRARAAGEPKAAAEWGWRWSVICLVPVVSLLALPLSRVNPRQGRYLKLLPAIVLYISYVVLLVAVKNGVEKSELSDYAFWGVHLIYLSLGLFLLYGRPFRRARA
ncbi:LPS export ABC transporter permease LptF [Amnimonas aquatica]|uniref:LPS export ABC transporter permease LptF n=1 Tax=Amnimonas aquatica TaxID=2094561 RepID=UPI001304F315|nr:LPS export ABC transporter permease LptF [Amnimonas aquatica]